MKMKKNANFMYALGNKLQNFRTILAELSSLMGILKHLKKIQFA